MCPVQYYQIMRNCKDKKQHRYQMVQYALKEGIKPRILTEHDSIYGEDYTGLTIGHSFECPNS